MVKTDTHQQRDIGIQIEVETPTKLSAKQREILEQFRATETGDECPQSRGFFDKTDRNLFEGQDLDVPTYLRKGIKIAL